MTVHARSDVSAVTISPDHGGCGEVHSRPVDKGAPVKLWSLTCPSCENILRHDAHWSGTLSGIPETPDEKAYREDQELKGRVDQQNQTAEALSKLASLGDLPAAMAQLAAMFSGEPKRDKFDQSHSTCTGCNSPLRPNAKFCAECGLRADVLIPEAAGGFGPNALPDLEDLDEDQLRLLAKEKGLKPHPRTGKAKLIELIQGV